MKKIISRLVRSTVKKNNNESNNNIYYIEVNPDSISHIKLFHFDDVPVLGEEAVCGAVDGLWDMLKMPYNRHQYYNSIAKRIDYGEKWEHTSMHKLVSKTRDKTALEDYYRRLDTLIGTIQSKGYKSQYQLGFRKKSDNWMQITNLYVPQEIIVGMDRRGRLIQLANGRRRLAIAQLLKLKKIPAILSLYHSNVLDRLPEKKRLIKGDSKDFRPIH